MKNIFRQYYSSYRHDSYSVWSRIGNILTGKDENITSHTDNTVTFEESPINIETVQEQPKRIIPRISKLHPMLPEIHDDVMIESLKKQASSPLNQALLLYEKRKQEWIENYKKQTSQEYQDIPITNTNSIESTESTTTLTPTVKDKPRKIPKELKDIPKNDRSILSKLIPYEKLNSMKRQQRIMILSEQSKTFITKENLDNAIQYTLDNPVSYHATPEEMLTEQSKLLKLYNSIGNIVWKEESSKGDISSLRNSPAQRRKEKIFETLPIPDTFGK